MKQFFLTVVVLLVMLVLVPERAFSYRNPPATSRVFIGTVTAYTSRPLAATASGSGVFTGVVACPRKYPFGTKVMIEGRIYECRDRLSRKYDDRFDIWKPTRAAAKLFGKRRRLIVAVIPSSPVTLLTGGTPVSLSRY